MKISFIVDGGWSEWSEWEVCPETCGALHHISRTRTCDNPAPKYGGAHCNADGSVDIETKPCPSMYFKLSYEGLFKVMI